MGRNRTYLITGGYQPSAIAIFNGKGERVFSRKMPGFSIWNLGDDDRLYFSVNGQEDISGLMVLTPDGELKQLDADYNLDGVPVGLADGRVCFARWGKLFMLDPQGEKELEIPLGYLVNRIGKAGDQALWLQVNGKSGENLMLFHLP